MKDLRVVLNKTSLALPVMTASGCAGYGEELSKLIDLNVLGAFVTKSATLNPRDGNPGIRIAETPSGMLNSIGLANPGIRSVIEEKLPRLKEAYHGPIVLSIAGFSIEEYLECIRLAERSDLFQAYELNLSCPNVGDHGLALASSSKAVTTIAEEAKKIATRPIYLKLKPEVEDIAAIAKAAEDAGADGLVVSNTFTGMRIDPLTGKSILAKGIGGFSGPAVFPMAVKNVWLVHKAVKIPVIGVGGVSSARDVMEMMRAGATAVQIGSEALVHPEVFSEMKSELEKLMCKAKVERLEDIIGRNEL